MVLIVERMAMRNVVQHVKNVNSHYSVNIITNNTITPVINARIINNKAFLIVLRNGILNNKNYSLNTYLKIQLIHKLINNFNENGRASRTSRNSSCSRI